MICTAQHTVGHSKHASISMERVFAKTVPFHTKCLSQLLVLMVASVETFQNRISVGFFLKNLCQSAMCVFFIV